MKLYLASQSPRRRELLDQIGVEYECLDVDINEDWDGKENARQYVSRLALEKARSGLEQLDQNKGAMVIGADTAVVLDDIILGKANTETEAVEMLSPAIWSLPSCLYWCRDHRAERAGPS